ncbi:hypothetical protein EV424DRAFT_1421257 [Suillus variegatus]|nr:hypothetical protein EV424DRAFT_1421257 [Suillus variegatus]
MDTYPSLARADISLAYTTIMHLFGPSHHSGFRKLARKAELSFTNRPSPQHQVFLPPDDHVLCFNLLYYISAHHTWEWELDYSPAWGFVGQDMRWTASTAMGMPDAP